MEMSTGFFTGAGTAIWSPSLTPKSEAQYIGALIGLFLLAVFFRALVACQAYLEVFQYMRFHQPPPRRPSIITTNDSNNNNNKNRRAGDVSSTLASQSRLDSKSIGGSSGGLRSRNPSHQDEKDRQPAIDNTNDHSEISVSAVEFPTSTMVNSNNNNNNTHNQNNNGGLSSLPSYNNSPSDSQQSPLSSPSLSKKDVDFNHQQQQQHSQAFPIQSRVQLPVVQPFVWQVDLLRALLTTASVGIGYMLMLVIMTYNASYFGVILAGVFVGEVYFGRFGRARAFHASSSSSSFSSRGRTTTTDTRATIHTGRNHNQLYDPRVPPAASTSSLAIHHSAGGDGMC